MSRSRPSAAQKPLSLATDSVAVTPNDLRHSCAAQLIDLGEDMLVIRDRFGHQSLQTTLQHTMAIYSKDAID